MEQGTSWSDTGDLKLTVDTQGLGTHLVGGGYDVGLLGDELRELLGSENSLRGLVGRLSRVPWPPRLRGAPVVLLRARHPAGWGQVRGEGGMRGRTRERPSRRLKEKRSRNQGGSTLPSVVTQLRRSLVLLPLGEGGKVLETVRNGPGKEAPPR